MTYDAANNNRGRTSLLTDYSRFKADVRPTSQDKRIPSLPPSSHRSCSRSRSTSRSRASLISQTNNLDDYNTNDDQEEFASVSTRNKFTVEAEELMGGGEGDDTRKQIEIDVSEMDHLQDEQKPMEGPINFTRMDSGLLAVQPMSTDNISLKDPFDLDDDTDSTYDDDLMMGGGRRGDPRMVQSEVIISCRRGGGGSTASPFHGSDTSLSLGMLNMDDTDAEEEEEEEETEIDMSMEDHTGNNNMIDDSAAMADTSLLCASEPGFIRVRRSAGGSTQNSMTMLGLDSSSPEQGESQRQRDRRCRSNSRPRRRSSSKANNRFNGNGSSSSLTNFLEPHMQDEGRTKSNLQSTGATTEDLRMEMNRLLMDTRLNRRRSSSSCSAATAARRQRRNTMNCGSYTNEEMEGSTSANSSRRKTPGRSKTLPEDLLCNTMKKGGGSNGLSSSGTSPASSYLPPSMLGARRRPSAPARSKSMGSAESAVAAAAASSSSSSAAATPSMPRMKSTRSSDNIRSMLTTSQQQQSQQAPQHHPALRRFRRQQQRNSCHTTTDAASAAIANLHNSTGRIDFSGLHQQQQVECTRKAPRRSKSMASSLPTTTPRRGSLPERSKTITYTTTRGKNKGGDLGTSNHGFLTGSRIKRIIPNNMN